MRFYIASHCKMLAVELRDKLNRLGISVTSSWIDSEFMPTDHYTESECTQIAESNFNDIKSSDALILISGPDKYSGGKFVEAGYAMALGKPVFVVGHRENMQMWGKLVSEIEIVEARS